ncbi:nucleotidyltransferase family protein [Nitrospirillum amazonense]|uniref:MurNAc alpha-1-phosphate uridylyltransferase n=1 Tax=Nitrospirillum amazonense TaxID=28077 RepID=A0A560JWA5_9PROT|nr:nucleotidyltransferase family protein [Nitrospirillum amazonense]MDG3440270.1 nucleotidyltransferase family protein [Nitrospirillum amazonense]TWB75393.1 MurNAc alpha-1-phosphate uridylyltransferase [Nitrospirillum amazonense]
MSASIAAAANPAPAASVPHTAMVLAAGLGLRMRPLTLTRPKPLVEVGGAPLLDHALDRLAESGVERAVVNTHHLGAMIESHLAGRSSPAITLSPEADLLETGGGVRHALPHLGADPIFVVNADILWLDGPIPALKRLAATWDPAVMDVLLMMMPTVAAVGYDGPGDYHMEADGRLRYRAEGELAPFVFAGVHIVKPELYHAITENRFSNLRLWQQAEEAGRLYGMRHDGVWFHVGTPDAVEEVNTLLGHPILHDAKLSQPRKAEP